jgi:hypothetical protein
MNTSGSTITLKGYLMKQIADFISGVLLWVMIPLIMLVYLFILLLLAISELFIYIFDRADRDRTRLIKKLLQPLQKR